MKFIIIHDGKKETEKMADILNASVSQFEDIATTVWSEKQYIDNKPNISSEEYLVFLGKTKVGENIMSASTFEKHYSEFNMRYGWLGKQAVLDLDTKYSFDEEKISKFSDLYNEVFKIDIEESKKKDKTENKFTNLVSQVNKKIKSIPTVGKVAATIVGSGFLGIFGFIVAVTSATYLVKGHIDSVKLNADANKLLLKQFIDGGLKQFLHIEEQ